MVGGTNQNRDLSTFRSAVPDILIATPGRLNDNLQQDRGMAGALGSLRTLVFDEGDRLLDMGFRCAGLGLGLRLGLSANTVELLRSNNTRMDFKTSVRCNLRRFGPPTVVLPVGYGDDPVGCSMLTQGFVKSCSTRCFSMGQ